MLSLGIVCVIALVWTVVAGAIMMRNDPSNRKLPTQCSDSFDVPEEEMNETDEEEAERLRKKRLRELIGK